MKKNRAMKSIARKVLTPFVLSLGISTSASALMIDQVFKTDLTDSDSEGAIVKFEDNGTDDQLIITFDNTSGSDFNTVITGIVFNIDNDISEASVLSFTDGNGNDLTSYWDLGLDINSQTTPGNTTFDIVFETNSGANGGIYNEGVASGINSSTQFPDIATLIIDVTAPAEWALVSIGTDSILRMQQAGLDGEGSWKIVTGSTSTGGMTSTGVITTSGNNVPAPATLSLLGLGMVGGLFGYRWRRRNPQAS